MWQHHAIVLSVLAALIVPVYLLDRSRGDIFLIDLSGLLISSYAVWFAVHVAISSLSLYLVDTQRLYALHGFPAVASAGLAALGYVVVGQVESARYEARIRLELLAREQARVTMIADGSGERMTFEVPHRTQGDGVTIEMPGDEPLRLLRDGRDLVSSDGEAVRSVRR